MERKKQSCDTLFSWVCRISMLLFTGSSPEPQIIGCELLEHANITCYWTAHSSEDIAYMMRVNTSNCISNIISMDSCNTTSTQCSVEIGSVSHCFCVDVLVFTFSISTRLPPYCFNGITEVKMYTPQITMLATVPENASCLKLEWKEPRGQYVQSERIHRVLQIEYHTPQQAYFPKVTAILHDWRMDLCGLYPGTKYFVRIRAQDLRAVKHWSSWSGFAEATTAEAAPVVAPELWRHIQPVDRSGQRRITLLWKPLQWPHTNGVILRYAASCWDELDSSYRDCGHLDSNSSSCVLSLSAHACNCNLTASNSAGTSPSAHIYLPRDKDAELQPPASIRVYALDDFQLKVQWTATVKQSESSFVVEWFPVPDTTVVDLDWRIVNGSEKSFIITGVHPEIPYNVSVRVLHNNTAGAAIFAIAFTRQGAPSVGPKLEVLQPTSSAVILKWKPVPLDKLRGFIQNYTVLYKYNGKMKSQVLSGDAEQFSLNGLSPGQYAVCVKVHTLAGGAESPWVTVTIGSVHIPVMAILLCIIGTLLLLIILLSQAERIQQCLCPFVPDPSKSSLSTWPPVCQHQQKLPVVDFKPSLPLFEPIGMGRGITGHCCHHHHEDSKLQAFSQQTRKQVHKQVLLVAEQTFSEPNVEEPTEELTTDLSYQNGVMETPQHCHHVSSSYPNVLDLGKATMDSVFGKSNIVPRLQSSYERLESCSETYVSSDCAPRSKSCLRVDTLDPDDLFFRRSNVSSEELTTDLSYQNGVMETPQHCHHISSSCPKVLDLGEATMDSVFGKSNIVPRLQSSYERLESCSETYVSSDCAPLSKSCLRVDTLDPDDLFFRRSNASKLKTYCYTPVSTSYLPVADSYIDFRTAVENSTNLTHKSNHFSRLESSSYSHVSATSLPVPEPSLDLADIVKVNTAELLHQSSHMPKKRAHGYIHLSTSYLPVPLTHSEADFTNSVHENNSMSGLNSCSYKHIQISNQKSCPDFEIEEVYRPLSAEEYPVSLQFSVQKQY
ncbi:interleukin-31 receptor subunit alpha [Ictalurus punctatus]|uniref:Interleukin-31 receptor subunit alpha n=1 Tax=Ictalurus punctatus TaxID=7998 RepID=A0A2D0T6C8_ICTPU|nr:interleukin-31 receptor subunit alpha [Ictalurus punctatus]